MLAHSDDFRTRSEPQWNITPDHGDHAGTNFYNQSAFKLCVRTLGFPNLYDLTTQTTSARAKSPSRSSAPGESLRREIVWKPQTNLDALKGKNIRLEISGRNVVAYSAAFEA